MSHRYAVAQAKYVRTTKAYQQAITSGTVEQMVAAMDAQAAAFTEMSNAAGTLVYGIRAAVRAHAEAA